MGGKVAVFADRNRARIDIKHIFFAVQPVQIKLVFNEGDYKTGGFVCRYSKFYRECLFGKFIQNSKFAILINEL